MKTLTTNDKPDLHALEQAGVFIHYVMCIKGLWYVVVDADQAETARRIMGPSCS